jgi:neuropeptide Y receptor
VGCPAKDNLQMLGAFIILLIIWSIALLCAAPLFIYKKIIREELPMPYRRLNMHTIYYCVEEWPKPLPLFTGRVYYSLFSLTIQYFIPILVVSSAYLRIYFRLKKRIIMTRNVSSVDERIQERRGRRTKRTTWLLISIALIFGISWLPLNFFNLLVDLWMNDFDWLLTQNVYIMYAVCHMAGMSSGKFVHKIKL